MALLLEKISIDTSLSSQMVPQLAMRVSREQANTGNWITLAHPRSDNEPRYQRYVGIVAVQAGNGTSAGGRTQIIATGQRIIGMITEGNFNREPVIKDDRGVVACFSVTRRELANYHSEKSRLSGVKLMRFGGADQDPFVLEIRAVVAKLTNSAHGERAVMKDLLKHSTDEGAAALR
jgi:hypothetical protein